MFDQQVLGLLPASALKPPAYEQIHQQARRRRAIPTRIGTASGRTSRRLPPR